jgi:subfamily B ATP-binding cassette protein MsbA
MSRASEPAEAEPAEAGPAEATGLFRWLWRGYLSAHWRPLLLALLLMAAEGASLGLFASQMQPMFDDVFVAGEPGAGLRVGLAILGVFLLRAVASTGHKVLMTRIAERTAAALRRDLLRHMLTLDGGFFQAHPPGQLIERVQGDVQAIHTIWSQIVTGAGRDLVALVALFAVAIGVDWLWTAMALIGVPLLILPSLLVQRYIRARAGAARMIAARMAARLDEAFHGILAVKLNALEAYQARRFEALLRERVRAEVRGAAGRAVIPALVDLTTGIGFLGVLIFGGAQVAAGDKTVGEFMAFFTAMALAFEPLRRLANLSGLWSQAAASVARMHEVLAARPGIVSPEHPLPPPEGPPAVEFRDVRLRYGEAEALRGLSFVAEAGRRTALVGPSGAGKSTVFAALARLVEPEAGEVLIGGVPVAAMDLRALRALLSSVSQDTSLFDDTLRENVLLGRTDLSEARLAEALEAARVTEFLGALPLGAETPVGPRGSALSGGQRQRVAIARALLRDTPVLLLDEATSALDAGTEAAVAEALERLVQGRTVLVIAHRLATVRTADRIVVMDRGRAVEIGTHAELLAAGGLYAELHRLQMREEEAGDGGAPPPSRPAAAHPPGYLGQERKGES